MTRALLLLLCGCMGPPEGAREPTAHELQVISTVTGDACDAETLDHTGNFCGPLRRVSINPFL